MDLADATVYPTPDDYHAAPGEGRTADIRVYASELWASCPSPTRPGSRPCRTVTYGLSAFYGKEQSGAGPTGTVVAYSTDTFHRGTAMTAPRSARFSAHVSYKHADNLGTGRHAWGDHSFHPDWNPFVEQATLRQLLLFGFPPPGHPYWTPQTLQDLAVRYPGLDTRP